MVLKRPRYDPQQSYDGGQPKSKPKVKRPHFDPQNSQDETNGPSQWQHQDQRPSIPPPKFTSFDVESALLPASDDRKSPASPQQSVPVQEQIDFGHGRDNEGSRKGSRRGSLSPVRPTEKNPWASQSGTWDHQQTYTPSPERQPVNLLTHDRKSSSTADFSSNAAGKLTPESQQTSNTSSKETDNRADSSKGDHQGDDSFYWHSGRSSSDVGEDHSQMNSPIATPEAREGQGSSATDSTVAQYEHRHPPIRSTSLSPAISAAYGASALGLGGPSDWEYFGDYEAEEIDDEDLYSRPRLRDSDTVFGRSAELAAERSAVSAMQQTSVANMAAAHPPTQEILPLPDQPINGHVEADRVNQNLTHERGTPRESDYMDDGKTTSDQGPTTPRPLSGNPMALSSTSPELRPDLDEIIRAWSEAPYVGKVKPESPSQIKEEHLENCQEAYHAPSMSHDHAREEDGVSVSNDDSMAFSSTSTTNVPPPREQPRHMRGESTSPLDTSPDPTTSQREGKPEILQTQQPVSDNSANHDPAKSELISTSTIKSDAESVHREPSFETSAPSIPEEDTHTHIIATERSIAQSEETGGSGLQKIPRTSIELGYHDRSSRNLVEKPEHGLQRQPSVPLKEAPPISMPAPSPTLVAPPQNLPLEKMAPDLESSSVQPQKASDALESEGPIEIVPSSPVNDVVNVKPERSSASVDQTDDLRQSATSKTANANARHPLESPSKAATVHDPYADLDPWGRASLNRFAAMLREESRAEANKDKLNIFNVFTSRESRLRVVLYGTEDELVNPSSISAQEPADTKGRDAVVKSILARADEKSSQPEKGGFVKKAVQRVNTMTLQRSLKALPALPANRDSIVGPPGNSLAPLVVQGSSQAAKDAGESEGESPSDDVQYSPGGRPIVNRLSTRINGAVQDRLQKTTGTSEAVAGSKDTHSPSFRAPIAIGPEADGLAAKMPAYRPPKYREPRSEVKNYLANRKSIIRPYSTFRQGTVESGSSFGKGTDIDAIPTTDNRPLAPTSQYSSNSNIKNDEVAKVKGSGIGSQPDLRRFVKADFDPLVTVLPGSDASIPEPSRLSDMRSLMESIPDDFSFIHQSVVAWDMKARKQREENERQRHMRQNESEQRIDSLFDDHEIGYGDISELESEFKRSEAARKAEEDRSEYQLFVSDVFTLVWTRLHYELDQLIPHYEQYSSLMNNTLAGKDMFEDSADGFALAPTMNLFLTLHQKIEIRHQKAFEAVLERNRRLKKTEISPWYTLSNIAKVKQLEKQFEDAEKKAIIEYCQQRDTRVNRLMDVLDENTLRGVGANQDYMEAIMKAVRRIASGRAFASVSGSHEPTAGMNEVEKAKAVTALLAASSEQIVQTFHVADMLLNSADYEVSVAKAKVADKIDLGALAVLKEERAKEDQKLMRDLEHRLALIREDTRKTNDEIVKLMLFLGVSNGRADGAPTTQPGSTDPEHEARIQKALEEAKRRNAKKES